MRTWRIQQCDDISVVFPYSLIITFVILFFLFEHLAPGAMALPNKCVLKEMKKRKYKEKQVSHRKEPEKCSLQYQRK